MLRFIPFILLLITLSATDILAQKYLVLDRYGKNRIKILEGERIHFKQKGNKTLYHDYIKEFGDSTITIRSRDLTLHINEFDAFYFPNSGTRFASGGTGFIGGGFLFAAAISPLIPNRMYDAQESAIIGVSFLASSQLLRIFKWKKFKLKNENSRIRILDTNPLNEVRY